MGSSSKRGTVDLSIHGRTCQTSLPTGIMAGMDPLPPPALPAWIEVLLPGGLRRCRVDVGGYRMHVMEVGQGRPVVLLHGNPTWAFLYRKVAAALAGAPLRLIMPDLIGLGFSDKPRRGAEHQLERHAGWLGALLDVLDLRDPVFVLQDWGGPIALRALADRPRLAGGLVILNTVVGPPRPGFRPAVFHRLARLPGLSQLLFRGLGFPQNSLHRVQADPRTIRGDVARAYRFPLAGLRNNVAPLALARMVPDSAAHASIAPLAKGQAFLEGFSGPVAIVWGDRDPVLGRVRSWIERLLPRARVTRTEAGHFLQEEVPAEIADAVRFVAGQGSA
jgi:pimeloyl-ACP methyl ester carboxylesterase